MLLLEKVLLPCLSTDLPYPIFCRHPERIWETELLSARLFLELVRAATPERRSGRLPDWRGNFAMK